MERRTGRQILVGLLLGGAALSSFDLLQRLLHQISLLRRQELPRPRPHPAHLELQLRSGRRTAGSGSASRPGQCEGERYGGFHDGDVVLDDYPGAEAVVSRSNHRAVDTLRKGQGGGPAAGLRNRD
ncbi:hypothetical protein HPP92_014138 [Vanilla planifolia]|nr:hypothetical protein HPP92_014138 [Vanilla planifolia]